MAVASQVESQIQQSLQSGDAERAVTLALRAYGPEILGFLVAVERSADAGSEIFSQFCEDLWRGIGSFRGHSAFRTWAYTLARNAAHRFHRDPYRRRGVTLSSEISQLAAQIRSSTLTHLKSEVREAMTRLREQLEPDEQALLVLRVDRRMAWNDIARILVDSDAQGATLRRHAAACRKRYERVKAKLREMAEREGLLRRRSK